MYGLKLGDKNVLAKDSSEMTKAKSISYSDTINISARFFIRD